MTDVCAVCAEPIRPADGVVAQAVDPAQYERFQERLDDGLDAIPAAGWRYWVHVSCTKDGTERWCRAGRPEASPLDWTRTQGLNWTGLQGQAERGRSILD